MSFGLVSAAYVAAAVLFILSLGGLSGQESAKRAVWYGIAGMALAVGATVFGPGVGNYAVIAAMLVIGSAIGWYVAKTVAMTEMPQLVAALHSFVGLAAVFIGFNADLELSRVLALDEAARQCAHRLCRGAGAQDRRGDRDPAGRGVPRRVHRRGDLHRLGRSPSASSPARSTARPGSCRAGMGSMPAAALLSLVLLVLYVNGAGIWALVAMTLLAFFIGYHLIMGIGGADMPVVVSMLNSYSGWAAAAIGFTLGNDLLIVTGALVGSSGAILSYIMCKAMNRSFISVILGGFGATTGPVMAIAGEQIAIDADGVATALEEADSVVIVPGYGMAVAQAQQSVSELTRRLRAKGKQVRFAIHPVAGPPAGAHERAAGRGQGAVRHRAGDGRDQRGLCRHRRGDRHRLERHRQSGRPGGPQQPDRRHAGAGGVEGQAGVRVEARAGDRLFRDREPAVLQGQHPHVLRRCQSQHRSARPGHLNGLRRTLMNKLPWMCDIILADSNRPDEFQLASRQILEPTCRIAG